ncbi:MAG: trypsin-like peptidase domain-containing protein [Cyanobacteria bacterium SID2]|nr:trypsin-like peptidase domain-containing protein [Cyanobacteria bacterium SID2]
MTPSRERSPSVGTKLAVGFGVFLVGVAAVTVGERIGAWLWQQHKPLLATENSLFAGVTDPNFIERAVRRVEPSVVRIEMMSTVESPTLDRFEEPLPPGWFGGTPELTPRPQRGVGSGFVIDGEGHVLTNAHVVGNAETVKVILPDGRALDGTVLGADRMTDVAVVEIQATNVPAIPLGRSTDLKPGEWAIAIGNPLGLDRTVTLGIISATGRSSRDVGVPDKRVGFLQTDAAINPGNSGGPLINALGEAIGMNTAIREGAQGLGFAIPIETALRVAGQLVETGKAEHPYLGIRMLTIDERMNWEEVRHPWLPEQISIEEGILVVRVISGSPADRAGIQAGDAILKLDGRPVANSEAVQQIVSESEVGRSIDVEVMRGEKTLSISVRLGELPRVRTQVKE